MAKQSQIAKARSIIRKIEEKYDLDLGEVSLRLREYAYQDGLFTPRSGSAQIAIRRDLRGRGFEAAVYHEAGHLFLHRYSIPKELYSKFEGRKGCGMTKAELDECEDEDTFPFGYVSLYAATENKEEDFCETFAAFMMNNGRVSGSIHYEGFNLNLNSDPELRQKLKAIKSALESSRRKSRERIRKQRSNVVSMEDFKDLYRSNASFFSGDRDKEIGEDNAREIERIKRLVAK